jgi:hypothetical protein
MPVGIRGRGVENPQVFDKRRFVNRVLHSDYLQESQTKMVLLHNNKKIVSPRSGKVYNLILNSKSL